jgi:pimeloyl-ACP methyl ester carboxylesterase
VYEYVPNFLKPNGGDTEKKPDDFKDEFEDIVKFNGFNLEEHEITTDDGYILKTFRIRGNVKDKAPVVFLQHGMIDSSDAFVMNGRLNSPAFILADAGYDVWLGNNRGNRFSRKHNTLDPDSWDKDVKFQFWDFSFQEMAEHDALSNLDFIT